MRNFLCWLGIVLGLALIVALGASVGPCWAATETHDVVVVPAQITRTTASDFRWESTLRFKLRGVLNILDQAGTDYVVISPRAIKTGGIKAGSMALANGNTIVARSFIFVDPLGGTLFTANAGVTGRTRLDSLLKAAGNSGGGIAVPSCWLMDNMTEDKSVNGIAEDWGDSSSASANHLAAGLSSPMLVAPGVSFIQSKANPTLTWFGNSYVTGYAPQPEITGGVRPLLTLASGDWAPYHSAQTAGPRNKTWLDSLNASTGGADTMIVWDRLWTAAGGPVGGTAMPMTFVKWAGIGYASDSVGVSVGSDTDTEGDYTVLLYGLAHFDSVTAGYQSDGKGLIFKNMKEPFKLAPVVYGLGTRNLRRFQRGILPSDTSIAYATMDSIARLGIPITYAVDPDSAATYPRDVVVAMRGNARFTPQSWTTFGPTGLDSTNIGASTSLAHPVDVFGHFRNRAFYGDSTGHYVMGADSSITTLLIAQRRLLSALVGRDRLSRCVVAPFDDYSPLTMVHGGAYGSARHADSLVLAMQRAGYSCLLSDVRYRYGDPDYHPTGAQALTNPWGWFMKQRMHYNQINGEKFMILGHNPQPLMQGERQAVAFSDSATWAHQQTTMAVPRAFNGAVLQTPVIDIDQQQQPGNTNYFSDLTNFENYLAIRIDAEEFNTMPQHASVISLPFSAISGDPANPARSGWWALKWLNNVMANTNEAAGKTIIRWAYPEDITR